MGDAYTTLLHLGNFIHKTVPRPSLLRLPSRPSSRPATTPPSSETTAPSSQRRSPLSRTGSSASSPHTCTWRTWWRRGEGEIGVGPIRGQLELIYRTCDRNVGETEVSKVKFQYFDKRFIFSYLTQILYKNTYMQLSRAQTRIEHSPQ